MQLSMTVLRCPDKVAPETRMVSGGEYHVGRGPDVDWVLPDPDRLLSKRHFAVAFRGGTWQVADTSTNGTYLNTEADSIGRGGARSLRDGDRLRLGAYEIEVRLVDQPAQGMAPQGMSSQGMSSQGMSRGRDGGGGFGDAGGGRSGQSPFGDPFADDPLAPSPAPRRPFDEPAYSDLGMAQTGAQLPHDFDPLAPDQDDQAYGGFRGPIQSDHSSSMDDAMVPPPIAGYTAPRSGGIIPGDDLLPDDWDKDLLEGIGAPQPARPEPGPAAASAMPRPASGMDASMAPRPRGSLMSSPGAAPSNSPRSQSPDFFNGLDPLASQPDALPPRPAEPFTAAPPIAAPIVRQRAPRPAGSPAMSPTAEARHPDAGPFSPDPGSLDDPDPPSVPPHISARPLTPAPDQAVSPFDEPSGSFRPAPAASAGAFPAASFGAPLGASLGSTLGAPPVAAPAASAGRSAKETAAAPDDSAVLAAFFKGAELGGAAPADPVAMMTGLGMAFRALVSGLRAVLIARATIKSEFRIEQTMIRARGNNPLKFSANDDDALTALLGVGRRTDMAPAAAIEDSLRDLRMHEVAVMAAMQVAVRAMLDDLGPDKIRAAAGDGMSVLPAQRKARAWDLFETRHATMVRALMDDFDSLFGKSFARAYERALDEISARERQ